MGGQEAGVGWLNSSTNSFSPGSSSERVSNASAVSPGLRGIGLKCWHPGSKPEMTTNAQSLNKCLIAIWIQAQGMVGKGLGEASQMLRVVGQSGCYGRKSAARGSPSALRAAALPN